MTFGERLASLRKEHGWMLVATRVAIERETGHLVAIGYLSDLAKDRKEPTLSTVARIASAFGMSGQQFLAPVDLDERRAIAGIGGK